MTVLTERSALAPDPVRAKKPRMSAGRLAARKTSADARNIFNDSLTPWPRRKYEGEWILSTPATASQPSGIANDRFASSGRMPAI